MLAFSLLVLVCSFSYGLNSAKASVVMFKYGAIEVPAGYGEEVLSGALDTVGISGKLTSIKIRGYRIANTSACVNHKFRINTGNAESTNEVDFNGGMQDRIFYFDGTADVSGVNYFRMNSSSGGNSPCNDWDYNIKLQGSQDNDATNGYQTLNTNYDIWFELNNDSSDMAHFQSPVEGNVSHDFKKWWVCADIPAGSASSYNLEVFVGLVGDGFTHSDNTKDSIGSIPIGTGEVISECPLVDKSLDLPAGQYHAQINVLNQNDVVIGASNEITFTLTAGTQIDFANDGQVLKDKYAGCNAYGNIIQRDGCKLLVGLFYTDDNFVQSKFDGLTANLQTRIPFVYPFAIRSKFESIAVADDDFSVTVPIALAGYNENWKMIDTNNTQLHTLLNTTRPVLTAILWLSFSWYLFRKGMGVFKSV